MNDDLPLRERKKRRTRQALVREALALFRERGFETVTVDEIADAANVSRSTFFRYFPTKEAVVFPEDRSRLSRFKRLLAAPQPGETPLATLRRACLLLAEDYIDKREAMVDQFRVVLASPALIAAEREQDRDWELAVVGALCARHVDDLRAQVIAGAIIGAVRVTLREWVAGDGAEDLHAMGSDTFALMEARMSVAS